MGVLEVIRLLIDLAEKRLGITATGLVLTLIIAYLVIFRYQSRRQVSYRKLVDAKLGLTPEQAHPRGGFNAPIAEVLEKFDEVSVVALEIRNSGAAKVGDSDHRGAIELTFTDRYIIDFRVSSAEPPILYTRVIGVENDVPDGEGSTVKRLEGPKAVVVKDGPTVKELDQVDLRNDLTRALEGKLSGVQKGERLKLRLPPFELEPKARFILLVELRQIGEALNGQVAKGYEVQGKIWDDGLFVDGDKQQRRRRLFLWASGAALLLAGMLIVLVIAQIIPFGIGRPSYCAQGSTTLVGSTAFAPTARSITDSYRGECAGATITGEFSGSIDGVRDLHASPGADSTASVSDGSASPDQEPGLSNQKIAIEVFAVVVNSQIGVDRLTLDQVKGIYAGRYTNWRQLGSPADEPIRLVGRNTDSGTREAFERHVLAGPEPAPTSDSCLQIDRPNVPPGRLLRCERKSTQDLLAVVEQTPGAIGYADAVDAAKASGVIRLRLDGLEPTPEYLERGYPFWTVELLYTNGVPTPGSVLKGLIDYLSTDAVRARLQSAGYLPCIQPSGGIEDLCKQPR